MGHRRVITTSVAALTAAGLLALPSNAGASSAGPPPSTAAQAKAALTTMHVHSRAQLSAQRSRQSTNRQLSYNWSGWGDGQPTTGTNTYTLVSGTWKVPTLKCTSEDRIVIFWVGLDGITDNTVEQAGTLGQCFKGSPFYYTWWEMAPTTPITVVGTTVHPGDQVSASVSFSSGTYTLTVTDSTTTGNNLSVMKTCGSGLTCVNSSAEWIAERPSGNLGIYPLAQFTTWTLSNAIVHTTTTSGTITTFPPYFFTMVDGTNSYNLAKPGSFVPATKSFPLTWYNSY